VTLATVPFLDVLKVAADGAARAEDKFRRKIAEQLTLLQRERSFAFRRLNLMRAVTTVVSGEECEEAAVAGALKVLSDKLGWSLESPARSEVLSHFMPVSRSIFRSLAHPDEPDSAPVQDMLSAFEAWYADSHEAPFWALFDHYVPETPRVDV
jgi:hypothetical protein